MRRIASAVIIACGALFLAPHSSLWAQSADLEITLSTSHSFVVTGDTVTYTLGVTNHGPDAAADVVVTDSFSGGPMAFQSVSFPSGWSCSAPAVGTIGTVECRIATLQPGQATIFITTRVI